MSWNSVGDFMHMGGYAFYVWSSYGVCAALIAAELWSARARRARAIAQARRVLARGDA